RRVGGALLEHAFCELPPYHDPHYGCEMQVLRFYSWMPNPKYSAWIENVASSLPSIQVITDGAYDPAWQHRQAPIVRESFVGLQFPVESAVKSTCELMPQ